MNRYVLRFTKYGNMRFISHLDLHRLFKRSLKKAGIPVDYSKGFNPHEMINVVQPLSLGFESDSEYFEMETPLELDAEKAAQELNEFLPRGMSFTAIKRIPLEKKNLSAYSEYASYRVRIPGVVLTQEQADQKWNEWKAQRDAKVNAKKEGLVKAASDKAKAAFEAEKKVNAERAEAIAKKAEELAEAQRKAAEEAAAKAAEEAAQEAPAEEA